MSIKWLSRNVISLLLFAVPLFAHAQEVNSNDEAVESRPLITEPDERVPDSVPDPTEPSPLDVTFIKKPQGEWIAAPIPNYNPSQGWGLALMGQYVFPHEGQSKPSVFAGAVFGTEKKSYGGMMGYLGRLNQDRFRLNIFGGYAKVNSDFYGIGKDNGEKDLSVLLEQEAFFFSLQALPKFGPVFVGPTIAYIKIENHFDMNGIPSTVDPSSRLNNESWVPGLKIQLDTRDNTFYPLKGYLFSLSSQFYDKDLGSSTDFQRYRTNLNWYFHMFEENVLAARAAFQANVGDVPFYNTAVFGQGPDLRGYKAGKYRDDILWATQAEYRHRFTDHWGAVAFAGVGDVADKVSDLKLTDLLWSGGVGARYRLGTKNPIDFRVDVAYGDDWAWYFSVNQAF